MCERLENMFRYAPSADSAHGANRQDPPDSDLTAVLNQYPSKINLATTQETKSNLTQVYLFMLKGNLKFKNIARPLG